MEESLRRLSLAPPPPPPVVVGVRSRERQTIQEALARGHAAQLGRALDDHLQAAAWRHGHGTTDYNIARHVLRREVDRLLRAAPLPLDVDVLDCLRMRDLLPPPPDASCGSAPPSSPRSVEAGGAAVTSGGVSSL